MKMTNRWNRIIYRIWAPFYDTLLNRFFSPGRKRAFQLLSLKPGEKVLLVGIGTGEDIPFLPDGVIATGIDLSPQMLERARRHLLSAGREVTLVQGDAQSMLVEPASFDAIAFNLILSVIPDPAACLRENLRALKPDGRVVIFDKFTSNNKAGLFRRFINLFTTLGGTDITRNFEKISDGSKLKVICNEPSILNGMYRVILFTPQSTSL